MASANDRVFDNGLTVPDTEVNRIVICSQAPTTFTEANVTYKLGHKDSPTISAPAARAGGGREVTVSAISDGTVTATGTATHVAYLDTTNSRLLLEKALSASQAVTNGNPFTLTAHKIGIPGPT